MSVRVLPYPAQDAAEAGGIVHFTPAPSIIRFNTESRAFLLADGIVLALRSVPKVRRRKKSRYVAGIGNMTVILVTCFFMRIPRKPITLERDAVESIAIAVKATPPPFIGLYDSVLALVVIRR